jgi:hypothetical protein
MNLQNKQQLTAVTQDARCKMQEFLSLTEKKQFCTSQLREAAER